MMQWKKIICCLGFYLGLLAGCTELSPPQNNQCELAREKDQKGRVVNDQCSRKKPDGPALMPERNAKPAVSVSVDKPVLEVASCLHSMLQSRFKLPNEYYKVTVYTNGSQTLALVNPFTKQEGLQMDVIKQGPSHSTVNLYDNGMVISQAWQQFPKLCI